jgi:hypothetical protein
MELRYFFRRPKLPVLIINEDEIFVARSDKIFSDIIDKHDFSRHDYYNLLDCRNEGWAFYQNYNTISPLVVKKHWTKKELIQLYNNSKTIRDKGLEQLEEKILYKTFKQIFDIFVDTLR